MRIILINSQFALLASLAFAVVVAGGAVSALFPLTAGVGPAALGGMMYVVAAVAVFLAGLIFLVIPLSLVSALTLLSAVLAGYSHLRWCRFPGVLVNFAGIGYFYLLHYLGDVRNYALLWFFAAVYIGQSVLLLIIPRRPNPRATGIAARVAQPLLYALPTLGVALLLAFSRERLQTTSYIVLAVILLVYALPFVYNYLAVPTASAGVAAGRRLWWKLGISGAVAVVALLVAFPLGLPLALATLILFEVAEMAVLHPAEAPAAGGAHWWLVRLLGRFPDEAAAAAATAGAGGEEAVENEREPTHGSEENAPPGR